ncbi:hypothetical protein DPMN_102317 [Dreissena polymorpha]|uniref:Uncharacterized protein n=1 Tax=Dreissena polymorpha TaxID=45954 RepID=A0A9D4RAR9_DREPO|nr:hypothetical protein DPMN_102317 [Dreissena polymorpha]
MFHTRLREIEAKHIEIQQRRKQELEEKEKKRLVALGNMTQDVCDYGLWQSCEQVNEGLGRLKTDSQKRNALQAQLRFRKKVLKQKHSDKQVYNFSRKDQEVKYIQLSVAQLQQNVLKLIQDTLATPTHEKQSTGIPVLVGKFIEHTFLEGAERKVYNGNVISVVPGFDEWYNV